MRKLKIKTALSTALTEGSIFQRFPQYGDLTPLKLGIAYVLQRSGRKFASSLVTEYCGEDGHLTAAGVQTVGDVLCAVFQDGWDKIYDALTAEYNPIENYDRAEDWSDTESGTNSTAMSRGQRSSTSVVGSHTDTSEDKISAFNSNSYQNANKTEDTYGTHTDTLTADSYSDSDATTFGHKNTHTGRVHGNIGVTSNMDLIDQEVRLRINNQMANIIFKDIDTYLTIPIYDYEEMEEDYMAITIDDIGVTRVPGGVIVKIGDQEAMLYDGTDGEDGITPDFRIVDGNLEVSYDE